jgi:hypothetical protein
VSGGSSVYCYHIYYIIYIYGVEKFFIIASAETLVQVG